jgi:signal transduction histidine kinase
LLDECRETAALLQSSLQLCVQILGQDLDRTLGYSAQPLPSLNLRDALQRALRIHLARHPGLKVSCHLHFADPLQLRGDSGLWQQVVGNLVANSLLHGFEGRSHGSIQMSGTLLPGRRILVHYCDDGKGLSEEVRTRLFEDGFSTRTGRGGSGLGMGIVRDLVHNRMGGHVQVHSPAQGVHISIEAPC